MLIAFLGFLKGGCDTDLVDINAAMHSGSVWMGLSGVLIGVIPLSPAITIRRHEIRPSYTHREAEDNKPAPSGQSLQHSG